MLTIWNKRFTLITKISTLAEMWHFWWERVVCLKISNQFKNLNQFENFKLGWKIQTKD